MKEYDISIHRRGKNIKAFLCIRRRSSLKNIRLYIPIAYSSGGDRRGAYENLEYFNKVECIK